MIERSEEGRGSERSRRLRVHITHRPPDDALRHLVELLDPAIEVTSGPEPPSPQTDVLVEGRPSLERLNACPSLEALIVPYAGVPDETRRLILDERPDLAVYNLHHNATAVAELAMALFLAAAKSIIPVDTALRSHDWRSRYDGAHTVLLAGKTAVMLGYGAIGSRIARVCNALGMEVHAMRRHVSGTSDADVQIHGPDALGELLAVADALFIALPLTPETMGLLGADEIASLPRSCVLVNIARGEIVEEKALFDALRVKRIAAAGIDVWYRYPQTESERSNTPPSHYPFHELDNVVMSPHRGGAFRVEELEQLRMSNLAGTLNAFVRGEPPPHRVDIHLGY